MLKPYKTHHARKEKNKTLSFEKKNVANFSHISMSIISNSAQTSYLSTQHLILILVLSPFDVYEINLSKVLSTPLSQGRADYALHINYQQVLYK